MVSVEATIEALVRRDRLVVTAALGGLIALAWGYLLAGAGMPLMKPVSWSLDYAVLMFLMWWIMMLAMMLPSAAPTILLFAMVNRKQRSSGRPYVGTGAFAVGYLSAWSGFSLVAVTLQWAFEHTSLLAPNLSVGTILGSVLLLAAGVYQLTPVKHACLGQCRSPHAFLGTHWRRGTGGAFRMGSVHGTYCVGCCWFLMGLLFVGGVMNLYWIVGLALVVLLEKALPAGHWLAYAIGVALLASGAFILVRHF